jgi:hypothetical protein
MRENSRTYNPEYEAVRSFETSGNIYPTTWRDNAEYPVAQYENSFATDKFLQHWVVSSG